MPLLHALRSDPPGPSMMSPWSTSTSGPSGPHCDSTPHPHPHGPHSSELLLASQSLYLLFGTFCPQVFARPTAAQHAASPERGPSSPLQGCSRTSHSARTLRTCHPTSWLHSRLQWGKGQLCLTCGSLSPGTRPSLERMNRKVERGTRRVSQNSALEEGGRPSGQRTSFFSLLAHSRAGAGQPGARGGCFKGNKPMR